MHFLLHACAHERFADCLRLLGGSSNAYGLVTFFGEMIVLSLRRKKNEGLRFEPGNLAPISKMFSNIAKTKSIDQ
jgi:hypothetical protein